MLKIQICALLLGLIWTASAYAFQISLKSGSASVTDFKTDLAACQCNITDVCDNLCCCDTACSAEKVSSWSTSSWCRDSASSLQKMCSELSSQGYSSFEDLSCLIYSNRGAIGYFYDLLADSSISYPSSKKFENRLTNVQKINQGVTNPTKYSENSIVQIQLGSAVYNFQIWRPAAGSICAQSYATISKDSQSFSCTYPIQNQAQCLEMNSALVGSTFSICKTVSCSQKIANSEVVSAASYDPITKVCSQAITGVEISLELGYSSGQYRINNGFVRFTSGNASGFSTITTSIAYTLSGPEKSGNPGYQIGKGLKFGTGSIYGIANADQTCAAAATASAMNIQFGINKVYTCQVANPCSSALYVDELAMATGYSLLKYASNSTESVKVTGTTVSSCNMDLIVLNILYSSVGWVADPQYYIIGAKIQAINSPDVNWNRKSFAINWIEVNPSDVTKPPTNHFYEYFSQLWDPLKSTFSNLWEPHKIIWALFSLYMIL